MNLSQQVCNLELSKKLKELGVKQESVFYWQSFYEFNDDPVLNFGKRYEQAKSIAAYTVAELGELLPWKLKASWKEKDKTGLGGTWDTSINANLEIEFDEGICVVRYAMLTSKKAKTEVDARALMLIYLIQNKLITL